VTKLKWNQCKKLPGLGVEPQANENNQRQLNKLIDAIKEFLITCSGARERVIHERIILQRAIRNGVDEKIAMLKPMLSQLILSRQAKFDLLEDAIWNLMKKTDQLFTLQDNQEFQNIGLHPIYDYFKYEAFLKFLILDPALFHFIAELQISESAVILDEEDESKSLREVAAQDDIEQQVVIKNVLKVMPEFNSFVQIHGHSVFNIIIKELSRIKEKYSSKVDEKPYYQKFVDAIDLDKIRRRYELLTGVDIDASMHAAPSSTKYRRFS